MKSTVEQQEVSRSRKDYLAVAVHITRGRSIPISGHHQLTAFSIIMRRREKNANKRHKIDMALRAHSRANLNVEIDR